MFITVMESYRCIGLDLTKLPLIRGFVFTLYNQYFIMQFLTYKIACENISN